MERNNPEARKQVKNTLLNALQQGKKSIAVFPAGTTTLDESHPWKYGVFHLAQATKVPLQVFRIRYTPLRSIAYIDNDFFPTHLARACSRSEGFRATIEFAPPTEIIHVENDSRYWHEWARA